MHQNKSIAHYFLADRSIGVLQNSFALAGDYLSAAAFLGSIAMYFSQGMDSLFYAVATLLGWVLLLLFFSDKLRGTGAFTFSDVINRPFNSDRLKILSAITSLFNLHLLFVSAVSRCERITLSIAQLNFYYSAIDYLSTNALYCSNRWYEGNHFYTEHQSVITIFICFYISLFSFRAGQLFI